MLTSISERSLIVSEQKVMLFICPQMNTDKHRFIKSDFICVYLCSSVDNFSSALLFVHYRLINCYAA